MARERVQPLDIGTEWEPNAPEPLLVQGDGTATLLVNAHFDDLDQRLVVFRFGHCRGALLGPPNDEARNGHRLWRKGLSECLWAGEVTKSDWIARIESENRVHRLHDAQRFERLRHVILLLKDSTFECVAEDVAVERRDGQRPDVISNIVQTL
jgi:hypothetical protein